MAKVYLSPSDQRENTYAYGNTTEDVQCGKIAQACKVALERNGIGVMLGQYDTMANRCAASDRFGADLHIPIHTNAFNETVSGTRMFCSSLSGEGYKACKAIFDVLAPFTPGTSENIKVNNSLFEIKTPKAPTVYIEVDFHSVPSVAKWIIEHTTEIGEKIAEGICNYFGIKFKDKTIQAPSTGEMYRIRKSWADAKSQIGAYRSLENAKKACKDGYYVFNSAGKVVYSIVSNTSIDYAKGFDKSKAGTYTVVPEEGLHLRTGASTNKTSLEILKCGAKVQCYGYYTNQWLLVKAPSGKVGYVYSEYLK